MKPGLSLIETIIYVTIVGSIIASSTVLFFSYQGSVIKKQALQEVSENARLVLSRLVQEIQSAKQIDTAASVFNVHPGKLVLVDQSGQSVVWEVSDGLLTYKKGATLSAPIISNQVRVKNLVFRNYSVSGKNQNINIELTLDHNNPENDQLYQSELSLTSSATIRLQ